MRAIVIGVDRLAEQSHLGDAVGYDARDLAHDVGELAAPLWPTGRRHDAIRALVVASALDWNPRAHPIEPTSRDVLVMLFEVELHRRRAPAGARTLDQRRESAVSVGSNDQVDVLRAVEQARPKPLRHAAGDTKHRVGLHVPLELAQTADHALLGVIANRTRIDENDVRAIRRVDRRIADRRE
jgi:hypothetical protein